MRKSLIVSTIVLVALTGCGGGGYSSDGYIEPDAEVKTVSGIVSDGPIRNARVFIDANSNGKYDKGEPDDITDENGSYSIDYINLDQNYLLIAEGSLELNTTDLLDNNESNMSFIMYTSFDSSSQTYDINPQTFQKYLKDINITDKNLTAFIDSNETNHTKLFQSFIDNKKEDFNTTLYGINDALKIANLATVTKFQCNDTIDTKTDNDMKKKDGVYYPSLIGYTLPAGVWVQYEYDNDGNAKVNELGIDFKYEFDSYGKVQMNISIIDTWIPLGDYCVNEDATAIRFNEGSESSTVQFKALLDEGNGCVKVAKYKITDTNTTFDSYYQLCLKQQG